MLHYYFLLCNKVPPNLSVLKRQTFVVPMFVWVTIQTCMLYACWYNSAWLLSRCPLRLQTSEGLTVAEGSVFRVAHSHPCCQETSYFSIYGLCHGVAWVSLQHGSWFSPDKLSKREGMLEAVRSFSKLVSDFTYGHFCHILLISNESLGPAHTQGDGNLAHYLKRGISKDVNIF